ncbi:MAG: Smr/MutS family protein [Planktomarina sp.]
MARKLRKEEHDLWEKVKETATPLRPDLPFPQTPVVDAIFERSAPLPPETKIPAFRIGSRSRPAIATKASTHPPAMDGRTFRKMTRGRLSPEARIDLHGMTVAEAHPELINFILTSAQRQMRLVLVITGKGRAKRTDSPIPERVGVLKQSLPMWLNQPPIKQVVLDVSAAHQKHGGGGAFYVYLRRTR